MVFPFGCISNPIYSPRHESISTHNFSNSSNGLMKSRNRRSRWNNTALIFPTHSGKESSYPLLLASVRASLRSLHAHDFRDPFVSPRGRGSWEVDGAGCVDYRGICWMFGILFLCCKCAAVVLMMMMMRSRRFIMHFWALRPLIFCASWLAKAYLQPLLLLPSMWICCVERAVSCDSRSL